MRSFLLIICRGANVCFTFEGCLHANFESDPSHTAQSLLVGRRLIVARVRDVLFNKAVGAKFAVVWR